MSQKEPLSKKVSDDLLDMIANQQIYKIGDKLPNELDLSEQLNVSRSTIREAVKALVAQDVLRIERGRGTFVNSLTPAGSMPYDSENPFSSARIGLAELMEIRLMIEPNVAYLAAIRATQDDIDKILYWAAQNEEKIKLGEERLDDETNFHGAIANATHNEFIIRLLPMINSGIHKAVLAAQESQSGELLERTIDYHRLITDFIRNKDHEGARLAMRAHILDAMKALGLKVSGINISGI